MIFVYSPPWIVPVPTIYFPAYIRKYLEKLGINVTESPADIDPYDNIRYTEAWGKDSTRTGFRYGNMAERPENLTLIYETKSPSLKEIAKVTNSRSDNFYAETLILTW